jgi:hypothetical protein
MAEILTDVEIQRLVAEPKPLAADFPRRLAPKEKRGHKEAELDVQGADGAQFRVIVRQSAQNPLDFSVILGYLPSETTALFRLRRYNGKHGEHTNKLERATFYDFHIHQATERYQAAGWKEDAYAEPTDRYADVNGAIECLIDDCGFERPALPLFDRREG